MNQKFTNSQDYETALTQWIVRQLADQGVPEARFSREAGLGKSETDGRTFRKIKQGKRHWSITDLCKIASWFNEPPSAILEKAEAFYQQEGILKPESLEKLMMRGASEGAPLISTWQKKGKQFILTEADPAWKKAAADDFSVLMGKTSQEIFRKYPAVTMVLEEAVKKTGQAETIVTYNLKSAMDKKLLPAENGTNCLVFRLNAVFVPPASIVLYAHPQKTKGE